MEKKRIIYDDPLRDKIIKDISVQMAIPRRVVKLVVMHQFDEIVKATKTNNIVEMSGFGKFIFKTKKAKQEMDEIVIKLKEYKEQVASGELSEERNATIVQRIRMLEKKVEYIKSKLNDN